MRTPQELIKEAREWIHTTSLPKAAAVGIVRELVDALEQVHAEGLSTAAELGLSLLAAKEERDAAIASAAAMRGVLVTVSEHHVEDPDCGAHCIEDLIRFADEALADNAGADLLKELASLRLANKQLGDLGEGMYRELEAVKAELASEKKQHDNQRGATNEWAESHALVEARLETVRADLAVEKEARQRAEANAPLAAAAQELARIERGLFLEAATTLSNYAGTGNVLPNVWELIERLKKASHGT